MALQVTNLPRLFKFNNLDLADPDPKMTLADVQAYYANLYPELTSGHIQGPIMKGDQAHYEFSASAGLKG